MANGFLQPEQQRGTLGNIGLGLSAFGAGVQGRGPEFLAQQQQQQQRLSLERQKAAAEDLRRAQLLLGNNDLEGVRSLAAERTQLIQQLGGDPSDTMKLLQLTEASIGGDQNALGLLNNEINTGVQLASEQGLIKLPVEPTDKFVGTRGGKALFQTPQGQVQARDIEGISTSDLESDRKVQSSTILPGGVAQIVFTDGTTEVRKVDGEELRIIKDAEDRGVSLARAKEASKVTGKGEAKRNQDDINRGIEAVQGIPILRRGLQLLERIETGGIDAARLRAKQLFGIEGADEGELSANLGRAVLAQLRETFGAAFTEREGARLERLSAGFGKSPPTNKRLLRQALVLIQNSSNIALGAAERSDDAAAQEQLLDFMEGRFDLTDEGLANIFNPPSTSPEPQTEEQPSGLPQGARVIQTLKSGVQVIELSDGTRKVLQ